MLIKPFYNYKYMKISFYFIREKFFCFIPLNPKIYYIIKKSFNNLI